MIEKEVLEEYYVKQGKTMREIGLVFDISAATVLKYMRIYGIKSRPRYMGMKGKHHKKEIIEMLRRVNTGKKVSTETRKKISEAKKIKGSGHKKKRDDGYIIVYYPTHPNSTKDGYIMEHHLVMEKHIGRPIRKDEVVHHKNHIRDDNRLENLQLMTFKEHASLHMKERWKKKKGVMTYQ